MPPSRRNNDKAWKIDVEEDEEADILEQWAGNYRRRAREVGHWRHVSSIEYSPTLKAVTNKKEGLLVLTEADRKWNLYVYKASFTVDDLISRIQNHPLYAIGAKETVKPTGSWVDAACPRWVNHDHLSYADFGFRTRRNFSVKAGYTKHGDGAPDRRLT